ncbi:MAG: Nif3-like dinuclear metal center hexameric protein, partial [Oscillospiraceae bacterium]|nr:Nif3-like dinuclear metal center hexameric protein [Oscillospiraceae bacterium]
VWKLIRNNISVISAHTNLDIAQGGVNDCLAQKLGLSSLRGLTVTNSEPYEKVVAFVPETHYEAVHKAMTAAGAGTDGNYSGCAFFTHGEGTFLPLEGANPYLGTIGQYEKVKEVRVEMFCEKSKTAAVVAAMKAAHPYEVPAYDIFEDSGIVHRETLGRVGELSQAVSAGELARQVKSALGGAVRYADGGKKVQTVAVCGGAGDSELESALACGADALVTGEAAHHIFIEAAHRGITLIEAGHFHTEAVVLDSVKERLANQFPEIIFTVWQESPVLCL